MAMASNPVYNIGVALTPSNSNNLVGPDGRVLADALYVGTATGVSGSVTLVQQNDNTIVLTGVLAGVIYPIQFKRVNASGTDATNLVALFGV